MKKIVVGMALWVGIFLTAVCFAESGIPNLVGTWTVKADGAVLVKGATPGARPTTAANSAPLPPKR